VKTTSKPSKQQPKSFFKPATPEAGKPAAPKPIDARDLRHVAGGATSLPGTRW